MTVSSFKYKLTYIYKKLRKNSNESRETWRYYRYTDEALKAKVLFLKIQTIVFYKSDFVYIFTYRAFRFKLFVLIAWLSVDKLVYGSHSCRVVEAANTFAGFIANDSNGKQATKRHGLLPNWNRKLQLPYQQMPGFTTSARGFVKITRE